jgi:DNA-binding beta-propeller fold protein YncE
MHSLSYERLAAAQPATRSPGCLRGAQHMACVMAMLGAALGCSSDDDEPGTVALADSGSITTLVDPNTPIAIPTTVAVRAGVAWVTESQFDQYPPLNMNVGTPGAFRLIGLPLAGGDPQYISLPDGFFPEGITVDANEYLYVGSARNGVILTVPVNSTQVAGFLPAGVLANAALGMTPSLDGSRLWVCDSDPTTGGSQIAGVGIASQQLEVAHTLPAGGDDAGALCNDLVFSPDGALWVTDSFAGRILRIPADQVGTAGEAPVWLEAEELKGTAAFGFGANGLAIVSGKLYVVNSATGGLYSIDPSLEAPAATDLHRVVLQEGADPNVTLFRPDGITRLSNTELLVVENGLGVAGGKRVVRVALDPL